MFLYLCEDLTPGPTEHQPDEQLQPFVVEWAEAVRMVEDGRLPERDYWARLAQRRPDLDIGALWRGCSVVRAELTSLIERVDGRVRLVAFTNDMAHWFGADWEHKFPIMRWFDTVLEAYVMGRREQPDRHLAYRARLAGELALVRWLNAGVAADDDGIVGEAYLAMRDLAERIALVDPLAD